MNPTEQALIQAFIVSSRRARWLQALGSPKKRRRILDCLNHCRDLDGRYATELDSSTNIVELLVAHGAPATCFVISDNQEIDGQELPLADAVWKAEAGGWGTLISCIPGQLAYYYDECGTRRRMILRRAP